MQLDRSNELGKVTLRAFKLRFAASLTYLYLFAFLRKCMIPSISLLYRRLVIRDTAGNRDTSHFGISTAAWINREDKHVLTIS